MRRTATTSGAGEPAASCATGAVGGTASATVGPLDGPDCVDDGEGVDAPGPARPPGASEPIGDDGPAPARAGWVAPDTGALRTVAGVVGRVGAVVGAGGLFARTLLTEIDGVPVVPPTSVAPNVHSSTLPGTGW